MLLPVFPCPDSVDYSGQALAHTYICPRPGMAEPGSHVHSLAGGNAAAVSAGGTASR